MKKKSINKYELTIDEVERAMFDYLMNRDFDAVGTLSVIATHDEDWNVTGMIVTVEGDYDERD